MKITGLNNSKGMMLLLVLSVVAVLAIATTSIILVSNSDMNMGSRQDDSTKSFYLGEAGIDMARTQLNADWTDQTAINTGLGEGTCVVGIFNTDAAGAALPADQLRIRSRGTVAGVQRTIEVTVTSVEPPHPATIDAAVETNGTLTIEGNAVVTGEVKEAAGLNFETTFGITKGEMETLVRGGMGLAYDVAFNNNATGVITWVESLAEESKVTTNGWEGDGIFIIRGDLKITGGTFNGILWVEGALRISGNPELNGALFVEGGATVDTTVTGTADITHNPDAIEVALEDLANVPPEILSWQEV